MTSTISENAQLNVQVSSLHASQKELAAAKAAIARVIGHLNAAPLSRLEGSDSKGARYTLNFSVGGPGFFDLKAVQEALHEAGLVGWGIEAVVGPKAK